MGDRRNPGIVGLPDYVRIYNGGQRCDMLLGPCACGAWHKRDEMVKRVGRTMLDKIGVDWTDVIGGEDE